jgi:hypothetical protein
MRFRLIVLVLIFTPASLAAQGLRTGMAEMFHFGTCGEPMCLDVGTGHGSHYIPASIDQSGQLIGFVANAVGTSISTVPLGGASGGATFTFEGGLPVRTEVSSGPIFSDRAPTIGRGNLLIGSNISYFDFSTIRGTPLDRLSFAFTHVNVGNPAYGDPLFENDIIQVDMDLSVNVGVAALYATYGLTDRIDLGVAVPMVRTSVSGRSRAQIIPFGETPHSFEGGQGLTANAAWSGSASGLGDVLLRGKADLGAAGNAQLGLLADVRLPTGDWDDLLGSGKTSVRAMGIVSAAYGEFSPHLNAGYVHRSGEFERSALLATIGFDQLLSSWATLAVDFISSWEVGDEKLVLPPPAVFDVPFQRELRLTNIPDGSDNVVYSSIGAKMLRGDNLTFVTNVLVPVVRGGFQPDVAISLGVEFSR